MAAHPAAPDPDAHRTALAGGERRERPGHEHRLVGLDAAGLVAELAIRPVSLDLVAGLAPPGSCGRDDPGQPGLGRADAQRVAAVLNTDVGNSYVNICHSIATLVATISRWRYSATAPLSSTTCSARISAADAPTLKWNMPGSTTKRIRGS